MLPFVHGRENQTGRKEIKVAPQNVYWEKKQKKKKASVQDSKVQEHLKQ